MNSDGWVKTFRSILDWEWFTKPNTAHFFQFCIIYANAEDKTWRGVKIERGSFVSSLHNMRDMTGLTIQQIRTAISHLKSTHEITCESTNEYTKITICNYEKYQQNIKEVNKESNTPINNQSTNNQHAEQQTNNNNIRSIRREEEKKYIEENKESYHSLLKEKRQVFVKPSVDEVREYCSERNNGIDAQSFFDFYESKGWMIGNGRMKDWKAAVRTWENKRKQSAPQTNPQVKLGVGEYITPDGRRTYANGRANVPMNAPPRQNDNLIWDSGSMMWVPYC